MKGFTPTDLKAIGYYAKMNELVPELSVKVEGNIWFRRKSTGERLSVQLKLIHDWWAMAKTIKEVTK
jgi:hypothetical protein